MRKKLLSGVLAAAALVGIHATSLAAEPASHLWSFVAHFEYADGFSYDYVVATGVSTAELPALLRACGRSHQTRQVVRYHCYPVPE